MARPFTELQPRDGETVLHCRHIAKTGDISHCHFWHFPDPVPFARIAEDGSNESGHASWLIACDECFRTSGGDSLAIQIGGHSRWRGDDPAIREPEDKPS